MKPEWLSKLKPYEESNLRKSLIQIADSVLPFIALMVGMLILLREDVPYWIVLILAVVTAGFYVRVFIIFHDCCHASFFASRKACAIIGHICGTLTFTAFYEWQRSHNLHHAAVSNLDKRGTGDVWTMTVAEYRAAGRLKKIAYRIMRNPFFLFGVAPVFLFLLLNRLPSKNSGKREYLSLLITNLALAGLVFLAISIFGLTNYLLVQIPVFYVGTVFGIWLFFIQHQFRNVYWARNQDWDFYRAALEGSSFYKLQPLLRWLSGNIGYHHIHHLRAKIPNYNLKKCYDEIPELREITPITLYTSLQSLRLHLWNEETRQLVSFASVSKKS